MLFEASIIFCHILVLVDTIVIIMHSVISVCETSSLTSRNERS